MRGIPAESPVIVAGDFNATPDASEMLKFQTSGNFFDTYPLGGRSRQYTWDATSNEGISFSTRMTGARGNARDGYGYLDALSGTQPRRIDYICLSHHFKPEAVSDYRLVLDGIVNGIQASDHYGVFAEVDLTTVLQTATSTTAVTI